MDLDKRDWDFIKTEYWDEPSAVNYDRRKFNILFGENCRFERKDLSRLSDSYMITKYFVARNISDVLRFIILHAS